MQCLHSHGDQSREYSEETVMIIHQDGDYWQFWQLISFLNTNYGGSGGRRSEPSRRVWSSLAVDWWRLSSLHSGLVCRGGRLARGAELGSAEERRTRDISPASDINRQSAPTSNKIFPAQLSTRRKTKEKQFGGAAAGGRSKAFTGHK